MPHPWPTESSGHPYRWRGPTEPTYYTDLPKATTAAAGTPGSFTVPAANGGVNTLAGMVGVTAAPATAWTVGQRVVLNDGSDASWNGTAWVAGAVPA
jgi:hypothetical protein